MESLQSTIIKRALIAMDFKGTTLKRIRETGSMIRPGSEQPNPGRKLRSHHTVTTTMIYDRPVHWITPKNTASRRDTPPKHDPSKNTSPLQGTPDTQHGRTVLFLHGGAYLTSFLPLHWSLLNKIMDKRTDISIIAPDYPLAPGGTWRDAFKMLDKVYHEILDTTETSSITLLADSAGAGLALAWSMYLRDNSLPLPSSLVLLSPWVDVSMENPDISTVDLIDPYLSPEALRIAGRAWAGDDPIDDWHVSPLHGDFARLPPTHLFTGTADILHPDALRLATAMRSAGTYAHLHTYEAMMHDWMMFSMPEADRCLAELPL